MQAVFGELRRTYPAAVAGLDASAAEMERAMACPRSMCWRYSEVATVRGKLAPQHMDWAALPDAVRSNPAPPSSARKSASPGVSVRKSVVLRARKH